VNEKKTETVAGVPVTVTVIGHELAVRVARQAAGELRVKAEELTAWAAGLGLEAADLDDLVHDAYSKQASEVNNGGLGSQVSFLAEIYGTEGARSLLSDLRPAAARRASAPGAAAPAVGAEQRPPSAPGQ
jgi:hypothetical protein